MTAAVARTAAGPALHTGLTEPRDAIAALLDAGSSVPMEVVDGTVTLRGRVDGTPVVVYRVGATGSQGALGHAGCRRVADAIDTAVRERCPVVGLWHAGGARLAEGVDALDGVGRVYAATVRASGRIPQVSVLLGVTAGGAALVPALTDVVVMAPAGRLLVTGPEEVRQVTGERVDQEALGGGEVHAARSGVAHVVVGSPDEAIARARRIIALLARPGRVDPAEAGEQPDLRDLLPEQPHQAYDVRPVVRAILDTGPADAGFEELQPRWAPNLVVGLGRLAGRTVGVLANNPLRKGGCLDALSAEKAARFVRTCDALGVPLVVLVDVPGYLPGLQQEWDGVVRRGAKLLHAFAEAVVPRLTLVMRKSYGGAYIAMNSRALGATRVFAWPDADVAVMGAKAAVGILHRRALAAVLPEERVELERRLVAEHERTAGGVARALSISAVDGVIEPADTRRVLAEALAAAPAVRGTHSNIPL